MREKFFFTFLLAEEEEKFLAARLGKKIFL